jgi:hypothetical protein
MEGRAGNPGKPGRLGKPGRAGIAGSIGYQVETRIISLIDMLSTIMMAEDT